MVTSDISSRATIAVNVIQDGTELNPGSRSAIPGVEGRRLQPRDRERVRGRPVLLLGHVGYSVGGGWVAQRLRINSSIDFRPLAVMALLPDIVDRALYILIIPDAVSGRLIAHTLVFQLALCAALVLVRREFWIYGLASLTHLALDAPGAAEQLLWPLLGSDLENVRIVSGSAQASQSFGERVLNRLNANADNYAGADPRAILFEIGGLVVLAAFAMGTRLHQWERFRLFVRRGRVLTE